MNHSQAEEAKTKNIIDMAMSFSAMTRVFEKKAAIKIEQELEKILPQITSTKSKPDFDKCHHSFCQWFEGSIFTAERKKNGTIKPSGHASYGQGAKVLDVALKVYVYYCHLPDPMMAGQTVKWLNAAVDNNMMKQYLKKMPDPETSSIPKTSIADVDKETYITLQNLVRKDINRNFPGLILPVQWDDVIWRKFNRKDKENQK